MDHLQTFDWKCSSVVIFSMPHNALHLVFLRWRSACPLGQHLLCLLNSLESLDLLSLLCFHHLQRDHCYWWDVLLLGLLLLLCGQRNASGKNLKLLILCSPSWASHSHYAYASGFLTYSCICFLPLPKSSPQVASWLHEHHRSAAFGLLDFRKNCLYSLTMWILIAKAYY